MKIKNKLIIFSVVVFLFACNSNEPLNIENTDARTEISKTWKVTENGGDGAVSFESIVSKDATDNTKVEITNFHNLATVKATVFADNTISVADQVLGSSNITLKNCKGTISSSYQKIDWTYTIDDPQEQPAYSVTASFTPATISKIKL
jgi:hypothetical protein